MKKPKKNRRQKSKAPVRKRPAKKSAIVRRYNPDIDLDEEGRFLKELERRENTDVPLEIVEKQVEASRLAAAGLEKQMVNEAQHWEKVFGKLEKYASRKEADADKTYERALKKTEPKMPPMDPAPSKMSSRLESNTRSQESRFQGYEEIYARMLGLPLTTTVEELDAQATKAMAQAVALRKSAPHEGAKGTKEYEQGVQCLERVQLLLRWMQLRQAHPGRTAQDRARAEKGVE